MSVKSMIAVTALAASSFAPPEREPVVRERPERGKPSRPKTRYDYEWEADRLRRIKVACPANGVPTGPKPKTKTRRQMVKASKRRNRAKGGR